MFLSAAKSGQKQPPLSINCAECTRKMLSVKRAIVFLRQKVSVFACIKTIQCEVARFFPRLVARVILQVQANTGFAYFYAAGCMQSLVVVILCTRCVHEPPEERVE
jgi:hypothetical protein